jgi:hypothetical protein
MIELGNISAPSVRNGRVHCETVAQEVKVKMGINAQTNKLALITIFKGLVCMDFFM